MKKIIKDQRIIEDQWVTLKPTSDSALPEITNTQDVIVPFAQWIEQKAQLLQRTGRTGVWLNGEDDPELLADDISTLPVVAVNFPQFADGRGYSIGRLLRERYRYSGELRAIGDVLRDQIFYLHRCGFNAFEVRADKSIEDALTAFQDFSDSYQSAIDQPSPLFRRRLQHQ
jgi:uncharacterized protein (DUF934 family)